VFLDHACWQTVPKAGCSDTKGTVSSRVHRFLIYNTFVELCFTQFELDVFYCELRRKLSSCVLV